MHINKDHRPLAKLNRAGFTLIELVVAIGISSIFCAISLAVFSDVQTSSSQQVEFNMLQQNQRGVLAIMERELRMIGMDRNPDPVNDLETFRVMDVRWYGITAPGTTSVPDNTAPFGSPALQFTADLDNDLTVDADETITYLLYDRDGDGDPNVFDLARSQTNAGTGQVAGRQILVEGVQALEFAFAFDADDDNQVDRAVVVAGQPPAIVWAMDSNNDGLLDSDLLGAGLNTYNYENGGAFPATVRPQDIRAVRVWILGRSLRPDRNYLDEHQYSVGSRVLGPFNDNFRRWLISEIIHCRNL